MRVACACGTRLAPSADAEQSCDKCGARCCASCAFSLGAARYCGRCAESVPDAQAVPLGASRAPVAEPVAADAQCPPAPDSGDAVQWLILVAKDQADLFAHLVRAFSRDEKVQILMDRRKDYSRNPPGMEERLRTHGAAVVRRK